MRQLALCLVILSLAGVAACGKRGEPTRPGETSPARDLPDTVSPTTSSPRTTYPLPTPSSQF